MESCKIETLDHTDRYMLRPFPRACVDGGGVEGKRITMATRVARAKTKGPRFVPMPTRKHRHSYPFGSLYAFPTDQISGKNWSGLSFPPGTLFNKVVGDGLDGGAGDGLCVPDVHAELVAELGDELGDITALLFRLGLLDRIRAGIIPFNHLREPLHQSIVILFTPIPRASQERLDCRDEDQILHIEDSLPTGAGYG
ncbi:hypothetical protein BC938DRAFT_473834 [Jimgerdemannia flammicorona]|uniref:Uncharacterized protein n=1 Tax=Jimgerdemannia flammicorona TaxID=994334 RepID=A0A433Q3A4_9FUNG|nr:hypothetical protein BC938DRAFT_473834 [Jimgerdemannia flammicorona]